MKLTILGSGTSTGVPLIACSCRVCLSNNPKDRRRRASILIENETKNIIIDTGPDFREQILEKDIKQLTFVLYTHYHYDHIGGLNDLRPFSFYNGGQITCWCNKQTHDEIQRLYPYVFTKKISRQVNLNIKTYAFSDNNIYKNFIIEGILIQPIRLIHIPSTKMECVGFVFNHKVGYLTDFKFILPEYEPFLYNLETLILGSPLYLEHPSHISIPEAFSLIKKYKPKRGIISHLGHGYTHQELSNKFHDGVVPAYDGLSFEFT